MEYTQLLLHKLNQAGDVMLIKDRITLREEVAERVWAHMLTINQDKDGRKAFYHVERGKEVCLRTAASLIYSCVATGCQSH